MLFGVTVEIRDSLRRRGQERHCNISITSRVLTESPGMLWGGHVLPHLSRTRAGMHCYQPHVAGEEMEVKYEAWNHVACVSIILNVAWFSIYLFTKIGGQEKSEFGWERAYGGWLKMKLGVQAYSTSTFKGESRESLTQGRSWKKRARGTSLVGRSMMPVCAKGETETDA